MKNKAKSVGLKLRSVPFAIAASLTLPTGIAYADSVTGIDAISAVAKVTSDGRNVFYVYPNTQVNVTTSRTKFSHFDNRDNTLYINNNPKINTKLKEPSNVTIIENQSSQPMVIGNIEVLGKRSDILFVSPAGIVCDSCNFKNAGRVTLVAGSLSNNNQKITTKNGTITITGNGLTTADADIIDLVSEEFVQQAPIDTFVKARKLSNGEYTLDSSGSYLAAQTHLRINVGDYLVEYPTLRSTWNGGTKNNVLSIDHNINAGSLYIHAPGNITLASSALPILNTKADISIVGSHKDKSVIPFGSIKLTSYGAITLLDSTIVSPSQVTLNSDNLYISPSSSDTFQKASIDADSISFAVGDNIYNGGLITTGDARISAKNFYNAGKPSEQEHNMRAGGEIFASRDILIQAEQSLINVNRGMVVGNNVYLAAGADIHNGHGQPWRCAPSALEVATATSYSDNSNNVHYDQNEIQLGIGAELIKADSCPDNRRQNWLTEEREAYIFGFNIAMDAPTIVNSNPRLDVFRDTGQFKSRTNRDHNSITEDDLAKIVHSHQVSISAENSLHIKAKKELKNGSGSIEVLNGNLILDTEQFQNHRYYIEGRTHKDDVPWSQPKPISPQCIAKENELMQEDFSEYYKWGNIGSHISVSRLDFINFKDNFDKIRNASTYYRSYDRVMKSVYKSPWTEYKYEYVPEYKCNSEWTLEKGYVRTCEWVSEFKRVEIRHSGEWQTVWENEWVNHFHSDAQKHSRAQELLNIVSGCSEYLKPRGQTYVEIKENWIAANTPIPRVLVGKDLHITSEKANSFSNLAGNLEILGNITGKLTSFENLGLKLQQSKLERNDIDHEEVYCSKRILGICLKRKTEKWTTTSKSLISISEIGKLPALFYLGDGDFNVTGIERPQQDKEGTILSGDITYGVHPAN
ncbi:hypothetical protein VINI7043_04795 [Vibrio nigripulchritudo ATCC 27043]|uniref:two-partner secretion domain-containing protein n=1 Tax=Vibrio nigripulchritudo TaxID=28173 RepID=UPI00021C2301|nr:hypothetical protein [Vibrio nigripulchritudo]EGU57407.1 hypothetical protein VINI7043_04795 [Vibrio nigripulchritudo ATCC 27043]